MVDTQTHVTNPDAKMPPKRMYLVTCKGKNADGKPCKVAMTFDHKDPAFRAASRMVEVKLDNVKLMYSDVKWEPVDPASESATARKLLKRYEERDK